MIGPYTANIDFTFAGDKYSYNGTGGNIHASRDHVGASPRPFRVMDGSSALEMPNFLYAGVSAPDYF